MNLMVRILAFLSLICVSGCGTPSTTVSVSATPLPTLDPARMNTGNPQGARTSDAEWARGQAIADSTFANAEHIIQTSKSKDELLSLKNGLEQADFATRELIYVQNPQTDQFRIDQLKKEREHTADLYARLQARLAEF